MGAIYYGLDAWSQWDKIIYEHDTNVERNKKEQNEKEKECPSMTTTAHPAVK